MQVGGQPINRSNNDSPINALINSSKNSSTNFTVLNLITTKLGLDKWKVSILDYACDITDGTDITHSKKRGWLPLKDLKVFGQLDSRKMSLLGTIDPKWLNLTFFVIAPLLVVLALRKWNSICSPIAGRQMFDLLYKINNTSTSP